MTPYYEDDTVTVYQGDCLDVLPLLSGVTAVVSDPPYGLSFMGKDWDHGVPGPHFWKSVSGACLPGAPMLAFGGTRTYHRLVCAIEDAGWEIRDMIEWVYGSGFPKSLNIGKAVDKLQGNQREVAAMVMGRTQGKTVDYGEYGTTKYYNKTKGTSAWEGWGTHLKPSHEPICLAMKPLDGTFAANALEHGVAGLNVDGGRVGTECITQHGRKAKDGGGWNTHWHNEVPQGKGWQGRWPSNIIHDGSEEVLAGFPEVRGSVGMKKDVGGFRFIAGDTDSKQSFTQGLTDTGSAARLFYAAKSSKRERNFGLDKCEIVVVECWKQSERTLSWENADHKVRLLMDTGQSPSRVIAVSGAQTKDASEWNTILFGSGNTGQSLMDAACTTVMGTSSTIDSPTLNLLLTLNTSGSTAVARSATENGGSPAENAEHGALYLATTSARMASALGADSAVLPMRLRISGSDALDSNRHPTVKNLSLMRYLCTLVTMPERNLILDPFAGSGTTGVACKELGLPCILIEQDEHHCEIIAARVAAAKRDEPEPDPQMDMFAS